MRSSRAILSVKYTPVAARGGVRQAVGSFLRYIQYRDQHVDQPREEAVDRMLRYVAHRDRSSSKGRLFDRDHIVGDAERRRLGSYVVRSTEAMKPARVGAKDRGRAVYRMVLSPEDAAGLDLRQVARAAMAQLEVDAGELPPWIGAEHRNTAHPHVHIVLAARREVSPGRFQSMVITRQRLARMKEAMAFEIGRQRGEERSAVSLAVERRRLGWAMPRRRRNQGPADPYRLLAMRRHRSALPIRFSDFLFRVQLAARRYQRAMEIELEAEDRLRSREMER